MYTFKTSSRKRWVYRLFIVGAVGSTGLSTNLILVIESVARDNVIILILLTIVLCLLLGMGLPTTANYVVVASLMSMVLVDVGNAPVIKIFQTDSD